MRTMFTQGPRAARRWRVAPLMAVVAATTLMAAGCGGGGGEQPAAPSGQQSGGAAAAVPQDAVSITAMPGTIQLPAGTPGAGKPAVTIGSKDFAEQDLLNELYTLALKTKGYTITQKPGIGTTEVIDGVFKTNEIQMYPEYTGVVATGSSQAALPKSPATASETYNVVKQFVETQRQGTVFLETPFQNVDTIVVKPEYAQQYGLKTVEDLNKVAPGGAGVRLAAQASFKTRQAGVVGMEQQYGLNQIGKTFVPLAPGAQVYQALDGGAADAVDGFSTDPQLLSGKYVTLEDPKNIFGSQYVVPIVKQATAQQQGPEFKQTCDWVSSLLSVQAIQQLNQAVENGQSAKTVAEQFLKANGLQ